MDELQNIQNLIYEIRGVKVMLDKDLADLYHVTTGNLNKAVKRNQKRFPLDFMFQLNQEEFQKLKENLIFQNGISNWGGTRKLPYAFTEQGLAMLSGLLNSGIDMDETLRDQNDINESTRAQLDAISTALAELQAKPSETKTRKPIGFIQPENSDEEI
jgi:hypothetical protein